MTSPNQSRRLQQLKFVNSDIQRRGNPRMLIHWCNPGCEDDNWKLVEAVTVADVDAYVFEPVIWPQEVTLIRWTQPSGQLCLWQCFKPTGNVDNRHWITDLFMTLSFCWLLFKSVLHQLKGYTVKERMHFHFLNLNHLWKLFWLCLIPTRMTLSLEMT